MKYDKDDKAKLLNYYNNLITKYTDNNAQAQGWASNETENIRFDVFLKIGNLNGCSILDVGCGFGDLYIFLKNKKIDCSYKGIDINPEMIKVAKNRYSNVDFQTIDFGVYSSEYKFDYIFCSGALSFKIDDYKKLYFSYIKKMFELSKVGIAFNMLNSNNNNQFEDNNLYAIYSIPEVREYCSKLTDEIIIHQEYLPNDFTFFLISKNRSCLN